MFYNDNLADAVNILKQMHTCSGVTIVVGAHLDPVQVVKFAREYPVNVVIDFSTTSKLDDQLVGQGFGVFRLLDGGDGGGLTAWLSNGMPRVVLIKIYGLAEIPATALRLNTWFYVKRYIKETITTLFLSPNSVILVETPLLSESTLALPIQASIERHRPTPSSLVYLMPASLRQSLGTAFELEVQRYLEDLKVHTILVDDGEWLAKCGISE
jgi:hypothetical protein